MKLWRPLVGVVFAAVLGSGVRGAEPDRSVPLLDGKTLDGWVTDGLKPAQLGHGWEYQDSGKVLHLIAHSNAGELVTAKKYGDFILDWDWKLSRGSNNGVKYKVQRWPQEHDRMLGVEYQMIDDAHNKAASNPIHQTAAFYDIQAPKADKPLHPVGEWNHSRIIARGTHLEHWLNGVKVNEADASSDAWKQAQAKSHFRKCPGWGAIPRGRIMLTYHNDEVWYRNLRITPLN